jgi:hypothetical protein
MCIPLVSFRSIISSMEISWRIPYILENLQIISIIIFKIGNSTPKASGAKEVSNCINLGFQLFVSHFRCYQKRLLLILLTIAMLAICIYFPIKRAPAVTFPSLILCSSYDNLLFRRFENVSYFSFGCFDTSDTS